MDAQNKNIKIDEQDLFDYVFFPENLSVDKQNYIKTDKAYSEIISFYLLLKTESDAETETAIRKKIAEKIPAYSFENIIILNPVHTSNLKKQNGSRLAAGSTELKPRLSTKTFIDNNKEYLIKVLTSESETKVFVFSTNDEIIKNFEIVIEPNNLKYHLDDNKEPLIITHSIEADKIELRFD